ncbi:MAG: asparagine synthase C-terminal domain-containing protein [Anaerolineae bacterium]|nr:asparagine synthase C-terminal domain-containing protein [Anaerolineae bacterium]
MDSRLILGLAAQRGRCVSTVTFGQRQSTDVIYARALAEKAGSDHHYFEFTDGNWVREHAPFHLALTEGLHSWVHMHGISTLPHLRGTIDCNLTGWAGDEFIAPRPYELMPDMAEPVDETTWHTRMYHAMCQLFAWPGFQEGEARLLFTDAYAHLNDLAFDSLRQELRCYEKYRPELRLNYWQAWHHTVRLTHNYASFMRSHLELRYPFADYAVLDFVLGLPLAMRIRGRLQKPSSTARRRGWRRCPMPAPGCPSPTSAGISWPRWLRARRATLRRRSS